MVSQWLEEQVKMGAVYCKSGVDSCLVRLSEPLNARRAEGIRQFFKDLAHNGVRRVVVSLEDVPFIDSQGLVALISGYKAFGSDANNFRLVGIPPQPRLLFELTGFDRVFQGIGNDRVEILALRPSIEVLSYVA
jgi:anti-sigma B factor antagonist